MKKFLVSLSKFSSGFALSFFLGILAFTVGEFVSILLHLTDSSLLYFVLTYLFAFIIVVLGTFFWMKYFGIKFFIAFIAFIFIFYIVGVQLANRISKPFFEAKELEMESAQIFNKWFEVQLAEENFEKYFRDTKEGIEKLDKARSLNFGYEIWIQKHYQDLYNVRKEMYETDLMLANGELVLSETEMDVKRNEYISRLSEINDIPPYPLWMWLYGIRL